MIDYLKWLFNLGCKHERVRCIHGDEIIVAGFKRSACLDCPKLFDSLPEYCSYTLEPHTKLNKSTVIHTLAPKSE